MPLDYETPAGYAPNLSPEFLRTAITPLRLIFWGALIDLFDLSISQTTNGVGVRCDLLDDAVGTLLIVIGVFRLARFPVPGPYRRIMTFVQVVSILALIEAIDGHFIYPDPPLLSVLRSLLGLAEMLAIVLFCTAMGTLALQAALRPVAASWRLTRLLFLLIYVLPLGLLYLASLVALVTGASFNFNLGIAGLPLLLVFIVPLIHFFISTSRMKRAIESLVAA